MRNAWEPREFAELLAGVVKQLEPELMQVSKPNFWDVIEYGRGSYEIRYSKMIRWLLEPRESHGLGDSFAQWMFEGFSPTPHIKVGSQGTLRKAETEALGQNIDILYRDEQASYAIIIENKDQSADHDAGRGEHAGKHQLQKYFDVVTGAYPVSQRYREEQRRLSRLQQLFIYLSPEGVEPQNITEAQKSEPWYKPWICIGYLALVPLLQKAKQQTEANANADASKIIDDFLRDIRRRFDRKGLATIRHLWGDYGTANNQGEYPNQSGIRAGYAAECAMLMLLAPEVLEEGTDQRATRQRTAIQMRAAFMQGGVNLGRDSLAELKSALLETSHLDAEPFKVDPACLRQLQHEVTQALHSAGVNPSITLEIIARYLWLRRPENEQRYSWYGRGRFNPYEALALVAAEFAKRNALTTKSEFMSGFGELIQQALPDLASSKKLIHEKLLDVMHLGSQREYLAGLPRKLDQELKYQVRDELWNVAHAEDGVLVFDGVTYRAGWDLGYAGGSGAHRLNPVIRYFMTCEDLRYPLECVI